MTRRVFLAGAAGVAVALGKPRTQMGITKDSFGTFRKPGDTLEFLEYCASLGAGGMQAPLSSTDLSYARKLRERAEALGMFLELQAALPSEDTALFESTLRAGKEAGALCVRSVCLSGRRYERFATLEEWKQFALDAQARLARAVPIAEKAQMPLAIENHKDWTADEMASVIKKYSSEYLGVCLDTGNNIALLDDAMYAVRTLAPFAMTTHIKDMGVARYNDGFLLSEVPLGQGMLDMQEMIRTIRAAKPHARMALEMITRDPLHVPCLTDKYWATFPARNGQYLANTLRSVEAHKSELPVVAGLSHTAALALEEDNVKRCLDYSRDRLGL